MRCDAAEADVLFFQDRFGESKRLALRCAESGSEDDPEQAAIRAQAQQRLGELVALEGDLEGALEWRRKSWIAEQAAGRGWRTRVMRLNVAEVLGVMGRTDEAVALCALVEEEARADRDEEHVQAARDDLAYARAVSGDFGGRAQIIARAALFEAMGDAYRLTRALIFRALLAAEEEDEAAVDRWAPRMLAAFRAMPHDEIGSTFAMRRVAARLEERGRFELAHEVDALLIARTERYRAGLAGQE
jgi:hypothetical protein